MCETRSKADPPSRSRSVTPASLWAAACGQALTQPTSRAEHGRLPPSSPHRPRPCSQSHPSLDTRAETHNFPPRGKRSCDQAGPVCCSPEVPPPPAHAQAPQEPHSLGSAWLPPALHPACPGTPLGAPPLPAQAREIHSDHQCGFLGRPCMMVTVMMTTGMPADTVPGTAHVLIHRIQSCAIGGRARPM